MSEELKAILDELALAVKETGEAQTKSIEALQARLDAIDEETENASVLAEVKSRFEAIAPAPVAVPVVKHTIEAPNLITSDTEHYKYDNVAIEDLAMAYSVMSRAHKSSDVLCPLPPSKSMVTAMAARLESDEGRTKEYSAARTALVKSGFKANELDHTTQAGFGDEWVSVAYSGELWNSVRQGTTLIDKIPSFAFPAGAESMFLPLEGADPTVYKVAETTATATVDHGPSATVTSSKLGTGRVQMTLDKFGARTLWSGEMTEDAVIAFVPQLRAQFGTAFAESFESAVFDGDTDLTATTNINDIAGTPAGTEYWTAFNGMRKSALITTTANSRDGGAITTADFIETIKLMGAAGKNALDRAAV